MAEDRNKYFPALTGIRAIAAYMVFIHHDNPFSTAIFGQRLHDMADEMHIGVTLFFVLSGFLITIRYYDEPQQGLWKYFVARFARIYPMFFILVSLLYLHHALFKNERALSDLVSYFINITFLKGFFDYYKFSGISQSWSLTTEEMFYFSAPLIFILIRRSRAWLVLIPAALAAIGLLLVWVFAGISFYGFFNSVKFVFWYTFFGRSAEFFTGIGLALLYTRYGCTIQTRFATFSGIAGILFCLFLLSCLKNHSNNYLGINHSYGIAINNLLLPLIGIAPLFWGLITEHTRVQQVLGSKLFILLGQSSYVFYLVQVVIIHSLLRFNFFVPFAVSMIISLLLYKFMEEPLNKFMRRKMAT